MSFRHPFCAARLAALCLIAPLVLLATPHEAWALIGSTPSTESSVYNNGGSPNFTQGATGCTSTSVSFDTNSFVTCNSGAWAVQPVQIGTASSTPFTCSSTYAGMMYENSGTNAIQYCNGTTWTTLATGSLSGSGSTGYDAIWTSPTGIGTGLLFESGGNVGIGTTSPLASTEITGSLGNSTPVTMLDLSRPYQSGQAFASAASFNLSSILNTANTRLDIKLLNASDTIDTLPDTTVMTFLSSGNVGIGTTSPIAPFEVNGTLQVDNGHGVAATSGTTTGSGGYAAIAMNSTGNNTNSGYGSLQGLYAGIGFTAPVVLQPLGGNVGIGGTSPAVLLDIAGSAAPDSAGTQDVFHLTRPTQASVSWAQLAAFQIGTYNNTAACCGPDTRLDINLKAAANGSLTGDTNVMTLQSNGNVGIGTTSPNAAALLDVYSTSKGLLPPRMTNAQEIAIGTNVSSGGLLVYNTTLNELDVYDSATGQWEAVGANAADAAGSTGQIQFNSGGDLAADSNFFWDNTNKRLGIGTTSPAGIMDIYGSSPTVYIRNNAVNAGTNTLYFAHDGASPLASKLAIITQATGAFSQGNMYFAVNGANDGTSATVSNALLTLTASGLVGTSGKFGAGTTAPNDLMEVRGASAFATINTADNATTAGLRFSHIAGTTAQKVAILAPAEGAFGRSTGLFFAIDSANDGTNADTTYAKMVILENGNIGIGTTTPDSSLSVNGGAAIGSYAGTNAAPSNGLIVSGNVGIGSSSPAVALDLVGVEHETNVSIGTTSTDGIELLNTTAATASIQQFSPRLHFEGQGWKTNATAASQSVDFIEEVQPASGAAAPTGNLVWSTAVGTTTLSPLMTLTSGGSVGIGTASPGFPVDIWNTPSPATNTVFEVADAAAGAFENSAQFIAPNMITGSENIISVGKNAATNNWASFGFFYAGNNSTSNRLDILFFGGSTPMTLMASGNVGIGNTAPAHLLHVGSASASGVVAAFQNSADLCTLTPASSTPTWSCSSDVRLKTNIADTGDAVALLEGMRVRDFTMKATGERQTGVIAQELATAHPAMVHEGSDGFLTVDSPNPWMLVKAIQELKADNDNLRAANDNQSAQIKTLSARLDAFEAKAKQR